MNALMSESKQTERKQSRSTAARTEQKQHLRAKGAQWRRFTQLNFYF